MEAKLIALKLLLDSLGVRDQIDTIDDRKRIQKAVYLGQLANIDLGYRFGWYLRGPYSPALTKDYYSLAAAVESGDQEFKKRRLAPNVKSALSRIKPLLQVPNTVTLEQEDWLELLASLHFLRTISNYSEQKASAEIKEKKPHVFNFIKQAEKELHNAKLL